MLLASAQKFPQVCMFSKPVTYRSFWRIRIRCYNIRENLPIIMSTEPRRGCAAILDQLMTGVTIAVRFKSNMGLDSMLICFEMYFTLFVMWTYHSVCVLIRNEQAYQIWNSISCSSSIESTNMLLIVVGMLWFLPLFTLIRGNNLIVCILSLTMAAGRA